MKKCIEWLEEVIEFFENRIMTAVSGVFLAASLVRMLTDTTFPVDPAWVTLLISGTPLLYLALTRLIRQKWISSALLISIAMVASIAIGEVFAAGEVAFIMAIGEILEDLTVDRAKKGLSKLIALAPATGRRIRRSGDSEIVEEIPADQIRVGDLLRVLPGEQLPVDGIIRAGTTSVDQAVVTGESLPVDKTEGDSVFCGTMNCFGSVDVEATAVGKDSSLEKLIAMVKEAENKKAPTQRIADKWAVWLVPIALAIAIVTFAVCLLISIPMSEALNRAVTVLVVFCPCALALATPTTIMAAIGQATRHGVIIKSGEALELMGKADTLVFDKTGTLTYGKPAVCDVLPLADGMTAEELLTLTASLEQRSEHPLGRAVTDAAQKQGLPLSDCGEFRMEVGRGIRGEIDGRALLCGTEAFLADCGVDLSGEASEICEKLRNEGKVSILTSADGILIGIIALSDVLREDAAHMIARLHGMNVGTILLTGDHALTASYFASRAGIDEVHASLLPADKVSHIDKMKQNRKIVCMIGDGVNDAPALKTAHVGVAMGSMGSDIAVEAADIALMNDDIAKIPYLKRLSRSALNTIKGNITASMVINFVAVTLSVLGVLGPVTGALVHNAGSVLVVLNAALLYDRKFD